MSVPQRIAVVRALKGLGDFLCAVPALRAIRTTLPNSEVVLIGLPEGIRVAERYPQYVDRSIELPGWPGLPDTPLRAQCIPAFLQGALEEQFDLAIQMHGSGEISNGLTALLGAPITAGYYMPGTCLPDPVRYLAWTGSQPESRRWVSLTAHLGMLNRGEYLEFPVTDQDRAAFGLLARQHALTPRRYVCVHPGAGEPAKQWPIAHFAAVANMLTQLGMRIVITGTPVERPLAEALLSAMRPDLRAHAVVVAGDTDLGAFAALLTNAQLLVCNDSGASHLAAALGVPSVIAFTTTDPHRWAPANRRLHRIVLDGKLRPTSINQTMAVRAAMDEATALLHQGRSVTGSTEIMGASISA